MALARDVGLALGIVMAVFLAAFLYTGNWPPVVVIESGSMEHADDDSYMRLGTIDTGDLVLSKQVKGRDDVVTYLEGRKTGYKTYENYGDVIIYVKNGVTHYPDGRPSTPVIHRAMAWVEVKANGTYYVPGIDTYFSEKEGITIQEIGVGNINGHAGLGQAEEYGGTGRLKWSGFLTKGDSAGNPRVDQQHVLRDANGKDVQPVKPEFILGKARGELPWMGMLKLCLTKQDGCDSAPQTQKTMMEIVIVSIVILLLVLTFMPNLLPRKTEAQSSKSAKKGAGGGRQGKAGSESKPHPRQKSQGAKRGKGPPGRRGGGGG